MPLNRQAALNAAVKGLLAQRAFSLHPDFNCAYREPDTTHKCAVGKLIPDRNYRKALEGRGANGSSVLEAISTRYGEPSKADGLFLADMQRDIHDNLAIPHSKWDDERFFEAVREFARSYNLKMPKEIPSE